MDCLPFSKEVVLLNHQFPLESQLINQSTLIAASGPPIHLPLSPLPSREGVERLLCGGLIRKNHGALEDKVSLPLEKRGRGKIGSVLLPNSPSLQPLHQVLFLSLPLSLPPLPDYLKYVYYTHLEWQEEGNGDEDVAGAQEEIQLKHLMPLLTPSSLHQKESQPPSLPLIRLQFPSIIVSRVQTASPDSHQPPIS